MTMTMTTKELLALALAATPGPWQPMNDHDWDVVIGDIDGPDDGEMHYAAVAEIIGCHPRSRANAALIVAAVNALPALCAEVEALKAENERAWTAANRAAAKVRGWESTMVCTNLPTRLFPVDGWGPGGDGTVEIPQLTTEKLTSILDRLAAATAAKEPK